MNIFEQAAICDLTFESARGALSVSQLYKLPLTGSLSLDSIGIEVKQKLESNTTQSLVKSANRKKTVDEVINQLRLDIIVHIIEYKEAEKERTVVEESKRSKLRRIDNILAEKQEEALTNLSAEELIKLRNEIAAT